MYLCACVCVLQEKGVCVCICASPGPGGGRRNRSVLAAVFVKRNTNELCFLTNFTENVERVHFDCDVKGMCQNFGSFVILPQDLDRPGNPPGAPGAKN